MIPEKKPIYRTAGARDYKSRKPLPPGTIKLGFPWLRSRTTSKDPKDLKIAILANGAAPRHQIPRQILAEASILVCCDGALATACALGRAPDFVVGDGDSISPADRESLGDRFVLVAEQDTNDLAKAFRFVCSRAPQPPESLHVAILGATGLREDHTLGNIFRLVDFTATVPDTVIYTDAGVFKVVRGGCTFAARPGDAVSIFATVPGTKVTSEGLQWPLDGVSLDDLWSGTPNRTSGDSFALRTDGNPVLVYRTYPAE